MDRFVVMALASVWAPLLVAALACLAGCAVFGAIALVVGGRRVVARSAEYQRVTRLLEASARTSRLRTFDDALVTAADEIRTMTNATSAMCCSLDARGQWAGMIVDSGGGRAATTDAIAALRALLDGDDAREVELHDRLLTTRLALPPARRAIVASAGDIGVPLVVGAF